jgi:hypothetical protein
LEKYFLDLEKGLAKGSLILFVLCIIVLAASNAPVAQAQSQYISINPLLGPVGSSVVVSGGGFSSHSQIVIKFGSTEVARTWVSYGWFGGIYSSFNVPSMPSGTYTVTASNEEGNYASTKFTITSGSAPQTPSPSSPSSPSPSQKPNKTTTPQSTGSYPYLKPTQSPIAAHAGFWSPLTIALVVVACAMAFIIPVTFIYRRRGNKEISFDEELPINSPKLPIQSKKPTEGTPYGQPERYSHQFSMRPTEAIRYSQPGSYAPQPSSRSTVPTKNAKPINTRVQQSYSTKICRHCKRTVREDLNVCPYCNKRLK